MLGGPGQHVPGMGLNVTLNSSQYDPAFNTLAAAGSFKLPNIGRATHFSQAGAPT